MGLSHAGRTGRKRPEGNASPTRLPRFTGIFFVAALLLGAAAIASADNAAEHVCDRRFSEVCLSPDESQLITASQEGCINVWDLRTGILKNTIHHFAGMGYCPYQRICFSPVGNRVLVFRPFSVATMTQVWDSANWKELGCFLGKLPCAAFTPDGSQIIACGSYGQRGDEWECGLISVWDTETGQLLRMLPERPESVTCMAVSRDGTRLLIGSFSGKVQVWDLFSGRQVGSFAAGGGIVQMAAFLPGEREIIVGFTDGTMTVLDAETGVITKTWKLDQDSRRPWKLSADGRRMLAIGETAAVWDIASEPKMLLLFEPEIRETWETKRPSMASPLKTVPVNGRNKPGGTISRDGKTVFLALRDGPIEIRDAESGDLLRTLNDFPIERPDSDWEALEQRKEETKKKSLRAPNALDFLPRFVPEQLAGTSIQPLWTAGTGRLSSNIVLSPDGQTLLAGYADGQARLFDADDGRFLRLLTECGPCGHAHSIGLVAFSEDGRRALTASYDGTTRVWDVGMGTLLGVLTETINLDSLGFGAIALSPDGTRVLVLRDNPVLWEVDSQRIVSLPPKYGNGCDAVAFSPDGKRVLSGSYDKAWLWDLETGRKTLGFPPDCSKANIESVAFSRDGTKLLLAGYKGDPRIFDAGSGLQAAIFSSPYHDFVTDVRFGQYPKTTLSRNGDLAMTVLPGSGACLWDTNTGRAMGDTSKDAIFGNDKMSGGIFGSGDKTVLLLDREGKVRREDVATGNTLGEPFRASFNASRAHLDAENGQILGTEHDTGYTAVWNAETGEPVAQNVMPLGRFEHFGSVALSGKLAAAGIAHRGVVIWAVDTGETLQTIKEDSDQQVVLDISPDGERLLVGVRYEGMRLTVWKWRTNERTALVNLPEKSFGVARFTSVGARALSLEKDGNAVLWDIDNERPLSYFAPDLGGLTTGAAISPSGKQILLGAQTGISTIWDTETGTRTCYLAGHCDTVCAGCFSRDDSLVATSSHVLSRLYGNYGEIKIWEASSGRLLKSIRSQAASHNSLSFSADNGFLFECDAGVVCKWPVSGTVVPDVVGQRMPVAKLVLESAGLCAETFEEHANGVPYGLVCGQTPAPRTMAPEKSTVRLAVSVKPDIAGRE